MYLARKLGLKNQLGVLNKDYEYSCSANYREARALIGRGLRRILL